MERRDVAWRHETSGVRGFGGVGTASMVAGTLASAAAAYVYQFMGARTLGAQAFAPVAVLWTIRFLLVTVVFLPVEQLAIRRVMSGGAGRMAGRILLGSAALAVALGATAALARDQLFGGDISFAIMTAALAPGFAIFSLARGHLAGRRSFGSYGLATGIEAAVQLVLAACAAVVFSGRPSVYSVAMVVSPFTLLPWFVAARSRQGSRSPHTGVDGTPAFEVGAGRFLGEYVVGNAAAQTVLAGGPIAVASLGATASAVSVATLTMTLFRAPLTLSYNLVARILPNLVGHASQEAPERLTSWARRAGIGGLALALVAGSAGSLLGAPAVDLLFGGDFRPGVLFAGLVAGGMALALTSLAVQQALVALGKTRSIASSWLTALAVAVAVLLVTNGHALTRVAVAFVSGELVAVALLVRAVLERAPAAEYRSES